MFCEKEQTLIIFKIFLPVKLCDIQYVFCEKYYALFQSFTFYACNIVFFSKKIHPGIYPMGLCSPWQRWELPGNYPVFIVVMAIYHYVERIWRILVTTIFYITYMIINIYYPVEPVNIHIQSLINITQEKNWVITTKKW